jgi:hypothetical protein
MVTNRKLTIETLTKLGARKLAELLIAEAAGNRRLKQTLKLATSTEDGPAALSAIVRRRLVTLAKSRSVLPCDRGRELIAELDGLRRTTIETIGAKDSELASCSFGSSLISIRRSLSASTTAAAASALCFEWHATVGRHRRPVTGQSVPAAAAAAARIL